MMDHCAKDGSPKILKKQCLLMLTVRLTQFRRSLINAKFTVSDVNRRVDELELIELAEGVALEEVRVKTGCRC